MFDRDIDDDDDDDAADDDNDGGKTCSKAYTKVHLCISCCLNTLYCNAKWQVYTFI